MYDHHRRDARNAVGLPASRLRGDRVDQWFGDQQGEAAGHANGDAAKLRVV